MSQTSIVNQDASPVAAGTVMGHGTSDRHSKVSSEASAEIPFGVLVVKSSDEDYGVLLPSGAMDSMLPAGVVIRDHAYDDLSLNSDRNALLPKTEMSVLFRGRIMVKVEDAVDPGDPVRVRSVAGVGEQLGAFRSAADSTDCALLTGAQWMTSAGAGGYAELEIDCLAVTFNQD